MTLAKWGYRDSSDLVLPLIGPSTFRDAIGIPIDNYGFTIYPFFPVYARVGAFGVDAVNTRAQLLEYQNVLNQISFDPYVFQRNAYLQRRQQKIQDTLEGNDWKSQAKAFNQSRQPKLIKLYYFQDQAQSIF